MRAGFKAFLGLEILGEQIAREKPEFASAFDLDSVLPCNGHHLMMIIRPNSRPASGAHHHELAVAALLFQVRVNAGPRVPSHWVAHLKILVPAIESHTPSLCVVAATPDSLMCTQRAERNTKIILIKTVPVK